MQIKVAAPTVRIDGQFIDGGNNLATISEIGHSMHAQRIEILFDGTPQFPVFPSNFNGPHTLEISAANNPGLIFQFAFEHKAEIEQHGNGTLWRFKGT